jgi:hypothetical protein
LSKQSPKPCALSAKPVGTPYDVPQWMIDYIDENESLHCMYCGDWVKFFRLHDREIQEEGKVIIIADGCACGRGRQYEVPYRPICFGKALPVEHYYDICSKCELRKLCEKEMDRRRTK